MPIEAGTRLGPYEIGTLLGAGGMGQVYRARDPRLDRAVAIKVLTRVTNDKTRSRGSSAGDERRPARIRTSWLYTSSAVTACVSSSWS